MLTPEQRDFALHLRIDAVLYALAVILVGIDGEEAVFEQAADRVYGAGEVEQLGFLGVLQAVVIDGDRPVVAHLLLQRREDVLVDGVPIGPVGGRRLGDLPVGLGAVAVEGRQIAPRRRIRFAFLVDDARAQQRGIGDVGIDHAVEHELLGSRRGRLGSRLARSGPPHGSECCRRRSARRQHRPWRARCSSYRSWH